MKTHYKMGQDVAGHSLTACGRVSDMSGFLVTEEATEVDCGLCLRSYRIRMKRPQTTT